MAAPRSIKITLTVSLAALGMAAFVPTATAGCNANGSCSTWTSVGSGAPDVRTLPSTITRSQISNMRVNGMGANERLCPAACPVTVETPRNGRVQACYKVCTPVGASAGSYSASSSSSSTVHSSGGTQQSSMYAPPEVEHHYEFTYHPVIYVHYPVPVPVYGLPTPCNTCAPVRSRYGY